MRKSGWELFDRHAKHAYVALAAIGAIALSVIAYGTVQNSRDAYAATPAPIPTFTSTPDKRPVIAFLGDSYTEGYGASGATYSAAVAAALGGTEANFGGGGTGYVNPGTQASNAGIYAGRIAKVVASAPSEVIVQGGLNDVAPNYLSSLRVNVDEVLGQLQAQLPNAKIVVVGPAATPKITAAQVQPAIDAISASAKAHNLQYVDMSGFASPTDTSVWLTDGVHPNQAGYNLFAQKLISVLQH